jgi:hypothetical protein
MGGDFGARIDLGFPLFLKYPAKSDIQFQQLFVSLLRNSFVHQSIVDATVMPTLRNPRHERFAQLLANGRTAVDGYEEAGYKRNTGNGPALARTEEIRARVSEINEERFEKQREITAAAAERSVVTRQSLIEMAKEVYVQARQSGQTAAAVAALKEIGVLAGIRIERAEHGRAGEFAWLENLDASQLQALADGTLDVGAFQQRDGDAERTVN